MEAKTILKDLVGFNTINDRENAKILDYIEQYLTKLGFATEHKSKCLVMSRGKTCAIGFLGHTDTVSFADDWSFDPLKLTEKDGRLYGLGTSDMKGSIAAMLAAVAKVDFRKSTCGMKLFFTFDEEIGFNGIKELIAEKMAFPEYLIVGEPTANEIINGSKGLLELKVTFRGVSAHSSTPNEGINAIEKCINFINALRRFYKGLMAETVGDKHLTMNVGVINGGRRVNVVPDQCEVLIDFRTVLKSQNERIIRKVEQLAQEGVSFAVINNVAPFANADEEINMSNYITEASFVDGDKKYILGVGPINAHKTDEFITVKSLEKLEKQYIELIEPKISP